MTKRIAAALAATALVGVASAFAANPFSDVPPSSWAYQAVSQLAAEGIVVGYPDGEFKGQRDITRYEMAEIIARAMAHEERANAEQKAVINKLAMEFATELNNLGVRVDALENKVGNVKLTGDARIKYEDVKHSNTDANKDWTSRLRLMATADVNDTTKAAARLVMKTTAGEGEEGQVKFDRLWVSHNFGSVMAKAGRQNAMLGDGLVLDGTVDGVIAGTKLGMASITAGYTYPVDVLENAGKENVTLTFGQVAADIFKNVNLKGWYGHVGANAATQIEGNIYGAALGYNHNNFFLGGEFAQVNKSAKVLGGMDFTDSDRTAWMAGVGYGNFDQAKKGSASLMVQYFHFGVVAPVLDTTYDVSADDNYKGWNITGQYALAKNLGLKVSYNFDGKEVKKVTGENYNDKYYAELNYQF